MVALKRKKNREDLLRRENLPDRELNVCSIALCTQFFLALFFLFYGQSLYSDRYKLRSFPFVAHLFFPVPSLNYTRNETTVPLLRIAIVTGANSGLGLASTQQLVEHHVHVVMACRNISKCYHAQSLVASGTTTTTCLQLDLASFASVAHFAQEFKAHFNRLDILMLNGGIIAPHTLTKPDNIEKTFQVNYLSHFLLTQLLLPVLQAPGKKTTSRIVSVTSDAHAYSYGGSGGAGGKGTMGILGSDTGEVLACDDDEDFDKHGKGIKNNCIRKQIAMSINAINNPLLTNTMQNYAQAKLANIMLCHELTRRISRDSNVYCNSAHPGLVATQLFYNSGKRWGFSDHVSRLLQYYMEHVLTMFGVVFSCAGGAKTQVYAALSDDVVTENYRGEYLVPIASVAPSHPTASDQRVNALLYDMSMDLVQDYLPARCPERFWGSQCQLHCDPDGPTTTSDSTDYQYELGCNGHGVCIVNHQGEVEKETVTCQCDSNYDRTFNCAEKLSDADTALRLAAVAMAQKTTIKKRGDKQHSYHRRHHRRHRSTVWIEACKRGDTQKIQELINTNLDLSIINYQNEKGTTCLMFAAYEGYKDIVQLLLDAGADTSIRTGKGTAAALALRQFIFSGKNPVYQEIVDLMNKAKEPPYQEVFQ